MAKTIDGKEFTLHLVTWDQSTDDWDTSFMAYVEEPYKGQWTEALEPLLPLTEVRRLAAYNAAVKAETPEAMIDQFEEFEAEGQPYFKVHLADGDGPGAVDYLYPTYFDGHGVTITYPMYDVGLGWTWTHVWEQ